MTGTTTITESARLTTLVNVFTVSPDKQADLVAVLATATDEVMRHVPGFISANIHASTDGTKVINYAQWATPDAYQAVFTDDRAKAHMGRAAALAEGFEPNLYTVESVHHS
ncbi:antibiotic biosynthesis monooxygenase family protein [Actinokineospora bangkokensis]|uniref:Antibiotic biosynthesis monooxygenase n=1 Tax=Actinokineospora bangkokensis TaxID=1193682 RepID=A0A1Q9LKE3_9PSEU|nr:antibiotic biosynthesis monooxygenase family protein [Actinokineospora bangkokensis]OLR92498.1 antibiotic biosynthesis monooxygenase [Actinokineospora bangkokensis]